MLLTLRTVVMSHSLRNWTVGGKADSRRPADYTGSYWLLQTDFTRADVSD